MLDLLKENNTQTNMLLSKPKLSCDVSHDELNIMLVEDMFADATLTRLALQSTNVPFDLTHTRRGDEALTNMQMTQLCNRHNMYDLIMLDLGLPGMDGFEVLSELSDMSPRIRAIPIVILTAHENFDYIRQNYPLCIMSYLQKPCNVDELYSILSSVRIGKKRASSM